MGKGVINMFFLKKKILKTIFRIASYPTIEESGRGLHCYNISDLQDFNVIYLTWFKKNAKPFNIPANVTLYTGNFYTKENPKKGNFFKRIAFHFLRVYRIITFSIFAIYLILKHKVDIVHIHSPMFVLVSFFAKKIKKINVITFHGADFFRIENASWYRFFAKIFDLVYSISPRYLDRLNEIHDCEVVQIYNGINTNIYQNFNTKRKKQILAVANFKPQKGLVFLIHGFKDFISENKLNREYKLIIAGKGILFNEIDSMIDKLNLRENVKLVGQKNRDELISLYNSSEIFILSSLWEGFAKVLLEAMACGCKVISTNVDSAPLLLEEWGYTINHSDSDEISNSLKKIINDDRYPFDLQKKSISKFTWDYVRNVYISNLNSKIYAKY